MQRLEHATMRITVPGCRVESHLGIRGGGHSRRPSPIPCTWAGLKIAMSGWAPTRLERGGARRHTQNAVQCGGRLYRNGHCAPRWRGAWLLLPSGLLSGPAVGRRHTDDAHWGCDRGRRRCLATSGGAPDAGRGRGPLRWRRTCGSVMCVADTVTDLDLHKSPSGVLELAAAARRRVRNSPAARRARAGGTRRPSRWLRLRQRVPQVVDALPVVLCRNHKLSQCGEEVLSHRGLQVAHRVPHVSLQVQSALFEPLFDDRVRKHCGRDGAKLPKTSNATAFPCVVAWASLVVTCVLRHRNQHLSDIYEIIPHEHEHRVLVVRLHLVQLLDELIVIDVPATILIQDVEHSLTLVALDLH
mmetsp:Transcript_9275/g.25523  ORF Transcript_9275/g.25523 Transcript_9275/m.25523 type:complete len:357 (-) Transcript_9275:234-1304(-)